MKIILNVHKTLETLSKIKNPYLTLTIAFICSFNLWFLSIYFFNPSFLTIHGLTITLLTTFALTISWCLITGISVPKYFVWFLLSMKVPIDEMEDDNEFDKIINLFILSEIIILHSFFAYISYMFHLNFVWFLSISFWFAVIQYFVIDILVKLAYGKTLKPNKEEIQKNND